MREGFFKPAFDASIDVEAHKALIQPGATVKGMQLQALVNACAARGAPLSNRPKYIAFRDYPGTELVELLAASAARAWPSLPPREGLRRLGRLAYPTFRNSLVGRVVFAAVGRELRDLWRMIPKGYEVCASTGRVKIIESGEREVLLRLTDIYSFIDSWHVGIMEGAAEIYVVAPQVFVRMNGPTGADFWIRWEKLTHARVSDEVNVAADGDSG